MMGFVETLICWVLIASVIVGGAMVGLGLLVMKLIDNHGDIGGSSDE